MKRMIHWESTIERDAFILMDADIKVKEFYEQPVKIEYTFNGETRDHYPDALIVTEHDPTFIEIKSKQDSLKENMMQRTSILSTHLATKGYGYTVLTEEDIRHGPKLANARMVLRYGRKKSRILNKELVKAEYFADGKCKFGDVLGYSDSTFSCVFNMVLQGELLIDFNEEWNENTIIKVRG